MPSRLTVGMALLTCMLTGSLSLAVDAGQSRTLNEGVYTDQQATRGQAIYKERCSRCHGQTLGGDIAPPLTGIDFIGDWNTLPLSDLVDKIHKTMPADDPGKLTREQVADLVAYILQVGKFPAGRADLGTDEAALKQIAWLGGNAAQPKPATPAATAALSLRPTANLAQVMQGILFPSSNLIFDVQTLDPGAQDRRGVVGQGATAAFSGIFGGWKAVDNAAMALVESAALIMMPGRRCENGKPVPVEQADWAKYTQALVDAGRTAYRASQSRNMEAVSDASNDVADACLTCHNAYRDARPGGNAGRCVPASR